MIDKIKQYAMDIKTDVDLGLRNGTVRPEMPVLLYGRDNKVLVPFVFSYWVMPDGTVEYRNKLAGAVEEKHEKFSILPLPPLSDATALDGYIRCCEGLLGLSHKDFEGFEQAITDFRDSFERISAMNRK